MRTHTLAVNTESAELRPLYADLGCVNRREAEALKANSSEEALGRFHAGDNKAAAIIGRTTEIARTASN